MTLFKALCHARPINPCALTGQDTYAVYTFMMNSISTTLRSTSLHGSRVIVISQLLSTVAGAAHLHLAVPGVDDVQDAVDGERGLSDVCRHDALAPTLGRLVKDFSLPHPALDTSTNAHY